jgi:hypothetical protein
VSHGQSLHSLVSTRKIYKKINKIMLMVFWALNLWSLHHLLQHHTENLSKKHRDQTMLGWMLKGWIVKGIVSRKFDMLFWCRWTDKYFLHLFLFYPFLKYHRFHVEFSNMKRSAVAFY